MDISISADVSDQPVVFFKSLPWLYRAGQGQSGCKGQAVSCGKVITLLHRALIQDPDTSLMLGNEETPSPKPHQSTCES